MPQVEHKPRKNLEQIARTEKNRIKKRETHKRLHPNDNGQKNLKKVGKFKVCPICGKEFKGTRPFELHIRETGDKNCFKSR